MLSSVYRQQQQQQQHRHYSSTVPYNTYASPPPSEREEGLSDLRLLNYNNRDPFSKVSSGIDFALDNAMNNSSDMDDDDILKFCPNDINNGNMIHNGESNSSMHSDGGDEVDEDAIKNFENDLEKDCMMMSKSSSSSSSSSSSKTTENIVTSEDTRMEDAFDPVVDEELQNFDIDAAISKAIPTKENTPTPPQPPSPLLNDGKKSASNQDEDEEYILMSMQQQQEEKQSQSPSPSPVTEKKQQAATASRKSEPEQREIVAISSEEESQQQENIAPSEEKKLGVKQAHMAVGRVGKLVTADIIKKFGEFVYEDKDEAEKSKIKLKTDKDRDKCFTSLGEKVKKELIHQLDSIYENKDENGEEGENIDDYKEHFKHIVEILATDYNLEFTNSRNVQFEYIYGLDYDTLEIPEKGNKKKEGGHDDDDEFEKLYGDENSNNGEEEEEEEGGGEEDKKTSDQEDEGEDGGIQFKIIPADFSEKRKKKASSTSKRVRLRFIRKGGLRYVDNEAEGSDDEEDNSDLDNYEDDGFIVPDGHEEEEEEEVVVSETGESEEGEGKIRKKKKKKNKNTDSLSTYRKITNTSSKFKNDDESDEDMRMQIEGEDEIEEYKEEDRKKKKKKNFRRLKKAQEDNNNNEEEQMKDVVDVDLQEQQTKQQPAANNSERVKPILYIPVSTIPKDTPPPENQLLKLNKGNNTANIKKNNQNSDSPLSTNNKEKEAEEKERQRKLELMKKYIDLILMPFADAETAKLLTSKLMAKINQLKAKPFFNKIRFLDWPIYYSIICVTTRMIGTVISRQPVSQLRKSICQSNNYQGAHEWELLNQRIKINKENVEFLNWFNQRIFSCYMRKWESEVIPGYNDVAYTWANLLEYCSGTISIQHRVVEIPEVATTKTNNNTPICLFTLRPLTPGESVYLIRVVYAQGNDTTATTATKGRTDASSTASQQDMPLKESYFYISRAGDGNRSEDLYLNQFKALACFGSFKMYIGNYIASISNAIPTGTSEDSFKVAEEFIYKRNIMLDILTYYTALFYTVAKLMDPEMKHWDLAMKTVESATEDFKDERTKEEAQRKTKRQKK